MDKIGRYQIVAKLGQGGMGVVYRAFDTLLQRVVAIKVISGSIDSSAEQRERFFREARAAGQLSHRNIITIYDLGEHEGQPYLAMEFLEGEDLQRRLARPTRMDLAQRVDLAIQLCEGLGYAHARGVVHRDVKPANIFITEGGTAKILDFGLARLVSSELTDSKMMMGTINYMAPEQVRGQRADHRADIFSAGVVTYELLGGRKAFDGESFATTLYRILQEEPEPLLAIDPELPAALVAIVERALAKPREDRYQQISDMTRDLVAVRQQIGPIDVPAAGGADFGRGSDSPTTAQPTPFPGPPSHRDSDAGRATPAPQSSPRGTEAPARAPRRFFLPLIGAAAIAIAAIAFVAWPDRPATPAGGAAATPPVVESAQLPPQPAETPKRVESAAPEPAPPAASAPAAVQATSEAQRLLRDASARSAARGADDARDRVRSAKEAARLAEAATLTPAAYGAASDAERAAERLFASGRFADATTKFYEASGLFRSAEVAARSEATARAERAEAERAQRQREERDRATAAAAPPATPPVQQAAVPPPVAAPPPAPAPAPAGPPETPAETLVADLLARYEAALESRSLAAVKRVWPTIGAAQEAALRNEFEHASRIGVEIVSPRIQVAGASATVTFTRRYELVTTDGQRLSSQSITTMGCRRTDAGWVVDRVRFDPIR